MGRFSQLGAIIWSNLCTLLGLPISISHSLIGGLAGAGLLKAGWNSLIISGIVKVGVFIVLSPLPGMIFAFFSMVAVLWIFRNSAPRKVDQVFRAGQLLSSAAYSLGHGTNDAQKTIGIIALVLFTGGYLGDTFYVPIWVILSAHAAIALGTYTGGWNVIKTMGQKLTHLNPVHGFCAETSSALMLFGTAMFGIPVSTTHTITGAIVGAGATKRLSAVRCGIAGRIIWAWVLTIPASALAAMLVWCIVEFSKNVAG